MRIDQHTQLRVRADIWTLTRSAKKAEGEQADTERAGGRPRRKAFGRPAQAHRHPHAIPVIQSANERVCERKKGG
eukprot:5680025-Pleurochrysis_carterae.AAC.1